MTNGISTLRLPDGKYQEFYRHMDRLLQSPECVPFKSSSLDPFHSSDESYGETVQLDNCAVDIEVKYKPHTEVNKSPNVLRRISDDSLVGITLFIVNHNEAERQSCLRKLEDVTGVVLR